MKRSVITSLATGVLVATLGACTGSFEARNPVLLVVGYSSDAGGRVALIKDRFGEDGTVDAQLEFLPGSVRNLPAPAVDYDVIDRERARATLVVLSRAPAVGGGATGYLNLFSLRAIDPANPVAFSPEGAFTISNAPGDVEIVPDTLRGRNPAFCPVSVQVTQTRAFAAVFNEPSVCGGQGQPSIDLFDLRGAQLRLLQRITTGGAGDGGVGGGSFLESGGDIYLSQSPTRDLLYYAVRVPGGLRLEQATMPRPGSAFGADDRVPVTDIAEVTARAAQGDFVDLGRAGTPGDERLVVLFEDALASVAGFEGGSVGDAVTPVETARDNAFVIRDDQRETDATLLVSTPAAQRFSYVPVTTDNETPAIENARVDAVDAVIEPTFGFVYFVAPGQVSIFDLSSYDVGESLRNPRAIPVPELAGAAPSFVTWTQAVPVIP